MKRFTRLAATVMGAGLLAGAMTVLAAPSANAAIISQPTQYAKAYSWYGYKAKLYPRGSYPTGTYYHSKSITVKKGSTYVAYSKPYYWASAGTYTVYSKFRYKTRTKVSGYRTASYYAWADSCTITGVMVVDYGYDDAEQTSGWLDAEYTGKCFGDDYEGHTGYFNTSWSAYEYWVGSPEPAYAVGDVDYEAREGTITVRTAYSYYKYSAYQTRTYKRTVVVTKVTNTSVMTRTEWNVLYSGNTLYWCRKVIGSNGTLYASSNNYDWYRWKNTSGGYTYISFYFGEASDFYWYTD